MGLVNKAPSPVLGRDVFIATTAYVAGDVIIGDETAVMYHVVIRGDIAPIRIGARCNIQDGAILHTPYHDSLEIGDDVSVAHQAVLHCSRIGSHTLIAIGAILLDGCEIGRDCIVAAGSLLTPDTIIPDGRVVMGRPAKIVRDATKRDLEAIDHVLTNYQDIRRQHAAGWYPNIAPTQPNTNGTNAGGATPQHL